MYFTHISAWRCYRKDMYRQNMENIIVNKKLLIRKQCTVADFKTTQKCKKKLFNCWGVFLLRKDSYTSSAVGLILTFLEFIFCSHRFLFYSKFVQMSFTISAVGLILTFLKFIERPEITGI